MSMGRGQEEAVLVSIEQRRKLEEMTKRSLKDLLLVDVSVFHHRITFKPQAIVPDIDFRGSTEELLENASEFNQ